MTTLKCWQPAPMTLIAVQEEGMAGTATRDIVPPKSALGDFFRPGIAAGRFTPVSTLPSTLKELRRDRQNRATPTTMTSDAHSGHNVIADIVNGQVVKSYVTPMLDQNVSMTDHSSSSTFYYNSDERQSVRNLTASGGSTTNTYDYTAYGDKLDALTSGSVEQRYTYTGRELNEVSGDYYFRHRMYAAGMGGFLMRDPLGYIDGMSVYNGWFASSFLLDPFGLGELDNLDKGATIGSLFDVGDALSGFIEDQGEEFIRDIWEQTESDASELDQAISGWKSVIKNKKDTFSRLNGLPIASIPHGKKFLRTYNGFVDNHNELYRDGGGMSLADWEKLIAIYEDPILLGLGAASYYFYASDEVSIPNVSKRWGDFKLSLGSKIAKEKKSWKQLNDLTLTPGLEYEYKKGNFECGASVEIEYNLDIKSEEWDRGKYNGKIYFKYKF